MMCECRNGGRRDWEALVYHRTDSESPRNNNIAITLKGRNERDLNQMRAFSCSKAIDFVFLRVSGDCPY